MLGYSNLKTLRLRLNDQEIRDIVEATSILNPILQMTFPSAVRTR